MPLLEKLSIAGNKPKMRGRVAKLKAPKHQRPYLTKQSRGFTEGIDREVLAARSQVRH